MSNDEVVKSQREVSVGKSTNETGLPFVQSKKYDYVLFNSLHNEIKPPNEGVTYLCDGDWQYFHYGCDGFRDEGWGCGYRSLQSMCSWIVGKKKLSSNVIPSIREIQESLVRMGDKPSSFVGSREWLGSMEICFVIDNLFDIPCKILHFPRSSDLKNLKNDMIEYFKNIKGFVMMGGDVDAASKGIAGIHIPNASNNSIYLLVIDPHFSGVPSNVEELIEKGFIRWQRIDDFVQSSFYNVCLPQLK